MLRCVIATARASAASSGRGISSSADLRHADASDANFRGVTLTGAKVNGLVARDANLDDLVAEYVDASTDGNGTGRISKDDVLGVLRGEATAMPSDLRYFGEGDVLRNAALEFGAGSNVEIQSRFERCAITLGLSTNLVIGEAGILHDCTISGAGNITVHGKFFERESPGIVGPRVLWVSNQGEVAGCIQQAGEPTRFGFEQGCRLRVRILRVNSQ